MRTHAVSRSGEGEKATLDEVGLNIEEKLEDNAVKEDEYQVASTGARVTMASAKQLLHVFCAKLAPDK